MKSIFFALASCLALAVSVSAQNSDTIFQKNIYNVKTGKCVVTDTEDASATLKLGACGNQRTALFSAILVSDPNDPSKAMQPNQFAIQQISRKCVHTVNPNQVGPLFIANGCRDLDAAHFFVDAQGKIRNQANTNGCWGLGIGGQDVSYDATCAETWRIIPVANPVGADCSNGVQCMPGTSCVSMAGISNAPLAAICIATSNIKNF